MIVINSSDEFESVIGDLESSKHRIEELFKQQSASVNTIRENEQWFGDTQKSFHKKYDELSNNYKDIEDTLGNYIRFLNTTLDNYKKLENKVNTDIESNSVQLDVNS